MKRYEQAVTTGKWWDKPPPAPEPPDSDTSWQLVAAVAGGATIAFFWQREIVP